MIYQAGLRPYPSIRIGNPDCKLISGEPFSIDLILFNTRDDSDVMAIASEGLMENRSSKWNIFSRRHSSGKCFRLTMVNPKYTGDYSNCWQSRGVHL